ncbi:Unsaturated chondroitin disaccharide hydrolase [Fusarium oxysporum f. sp. cubense]|uniref:Unsaturated chondroitin disaccharide hydrolase n=1 Tax=Fusarium oxysporum f. sp. cubense TaxID=61366 RepID=A0A559KRS9_FUSOC|nr:Unsaturated chondroitin disaccharide hydrolase [Fusarium oxysporum f. sp. cubense]
MTRNASNGISNGAVPVIKTDTNGSFHCNTASWTVDSTTARSDKDWNVWQGILSEELYSENITAKIIRVAEKCLENNVGILLTFFVATQHLESRLIEHKNPPTFYPELVHQSGENEGTYSRRPIDFWTCGFFPGSIYALLERAIRYPQSMRHDDSRLLLSQVRDRLEVLGKQWSEPLHRMARRTDTHDLGFMMLPHMRVRWELFHDREALESIQTAAVSLYSRFDARVGAIRSWDFLTWQRGVDIRDKKDNFLVIVDSLCNLELLFYAAEHTGYRYLAEAATAHAKTLLRTHIRKEPTRKRNGYDGMLYSTCHVVNFSAAAGCVKEIRTAQGYNYESTWSRGQAWAILGYIQTYAWTGDDVFLDAACGLAEYFLLRLEDAPSCVEIVRSDGDASGPPKAGRYVPLWDFDAPIEDTNAPLRDASAGVVAACGMLLLTQALMSLCRQEQAKRYLGSALRVVQDTLSLSLSPERVRLESRPNGGMSATACEPLQKNFDCILRNSTVTWNEHSLSASADHGLVYADYYLIEFGNKLLQLGLCSPLR